jgi:hypothetical protein
MWSVEEDGDECVGVMMMMMMMMMMVVVVVVALDRV